MSRRTIAASVALALVAVAVSGCSLVSDGERAVKIFQDEEAAKAVVSTTVASLRKVDGVTEASGNIDPSGPGSNEATISVEVDSDATGAMLRQVAELTSAAFDREIMAKRIRTLTVSRDDAAFTQSSFGMGAETAADEIEYWAEVQRASGVQFSMVVTESESTMYTETEDSAGYAREFFARSMSPDEFLTAFTANYDAVLAVPDSSRASTFWIVPGMSALGLPPREIVNLLDDVRKVTPVLDIAAMRDAPADAAPAEGVLVQWGPMTPWASASTASVSVYRAEHRASDWPDVLAAARSALASPAASFIYMSDAGEVQPRIFSFFTEPCDGTIDSDADDQLLIDALSDVGVTLPAGGGPGWCNPAPPQQG